MSRTAPSRRELVAAIIAQGRTNSTSGILLHAAIAERLGLNPSDLKCADLLLSQCEDCTPGRLAELTGLSTGAITGVIDRLERAGFLVREHDPLDRRRVLLRMTQQRAPEVEALFLPLSRGVEALCENFAVAELAVVLRFMREIHGVTTRAAEQLREAKRPADANAPTGREGKGPSDANAPAGREAKGPSDVNAPTGREAKGLTESHATAPRKALARERKSGTPPIRRNASPPAREPIRPK